MAFTFHHIIFKDAVSFHFSASKEFHNTFLITEKLHLLSQGTQLLQQTVQFCISTPNLNYYF